MRSSRSSSTGAGNPLELQGEEESSTFHTPDQLPVNPRDQPVTAAVNSSYQPEPPFDWPAAPTSPTRPRSVLEPNHDVRASPRALPTPSIVLYVALDYLHVTLSTCADATRTLSRPTELIVGRS